MAEKWWRAPGQTSSSNHEARWRKHHGLGLFLMVWCGKSEPDQWDHDSGFYIDILNENLEESLLKMGLEDNYIFQQDNDPKHTAKKTQAFFRSCRIKPLEWPPQSPDLNPIENLWAILDNRVEKTGVSNKQTYVAALEKAWNELDPQHLRNLVESMPKRLQSIIEAKGGHIDYWPADHNWFFYDLSIQT